MDSLYIRFFASLRADLLFSYALGDGCVWCSRPRHRVRVVKEVDSKSTGLCPREFKSRRCRWFFSCAELSGCILRGRHRVRVVKELVLKANGLCPREFKSRRCRRPFFMLSLLTVGDWSSGMIPALGAGGREFDSRITPFFDE